MMASFEDRYLRHIFTINKFGLSTRACYVLAVVGWIITRVRLLSTWLSI
jgi:hypothetical protein